MFSIPRAPSASHGTCLAPVRPLSLECIAATGATRSTSADHRARRQACRWTFQVCHDDGLQTVDAGLLHVEKAQPTCLETPQCLLTNRGSWSCA